MSEPPAPGPAPAGGSTPPAAGDAHPPQPDGACPLEVAGERLQLLPDRAVAWPARRTLVVADIHFGKDDVFRRAGLAIPEGAAAEDLARLSRLLAATRGERLVVLGDFVHGAVEAGDAFPQRFAQWRAAHRELAIDVVAGNHDRHVRRGGATPFDVAWHGGALRDGPFSFVHEPDDGPSRDATPVRTPPSPAAGEDEASAPAAAGFVLAGHLHPVIRLPVRGGTPLRVPVFWQRPGALVLPAFGRLTGGQAVRAAPGECLFVAGPERVRPLRGATR